MFVWIGTIFWAAPGSCSHSRGTARWPRALGKLHPSAHTPHVSILCYAALTIGLRTTIGNIRGTFSGLATPWPLR